MTSLFDIENKTIQKRLDKLKSKQKDLKKLEDNFNILKLKYPDIKLLKFCNKYYLIANLDNVENKTVRLVSNKYSSLYYYFKVKEKELNCTLYSRLPYAYNLLNAEILYYDIYSSSKIYTCNIKQDYIDLANKHKCNKFITETQNFILSIVNRKFDKYQKPIQFVNQTDNPKIQQFIDNLIFA